MKPTALSTLGAAWGVLGLTWLLGFAVWRLGQITLDGFGYEWTWVQHAVCWGNLAFMLYSEGYRGFQKGFSPRSASRAFYIYQHGGFWRILFAPLFCAGYFGAEKRTQMVIGIGTVGIVILVVIMNQMPQPWRGIVDAGVVGGLSYGIITLWIETWKNFSRGALQWDPKVPGYQFSG